MKQLQRMIRYDSAPLMHLAVRYTVLLLVGDGVYILYGETVLDLVD